MFINMNMRPKDEQRLPTGGTRSHVRQASHSPAEPFARATHIRHGLAQKKIVSLYPPKSASELLTPQAGHRCVYRVACHRSEEHDRGVHR